MVGEGALKPQDLCVILHFCNSTSTHMEAGEIGVLKNREKIALFGGNGKMTVSRNVEKMAVFGENEKTAVFGVNEDIGVFEDVMTIS